MEYKIQPWKHQLEAIERAKALPYFALFFEMGAGKTGTAINILRHKFAQSGELLRTLVFCPPIVCTNWREEWAKHSKIDLKNIHVLAGSGKKRVELFREKAFGQVKAPDGELSSTPIGCTFITNYEALLMDDLFVEFRKWNPQALVFDESHKLKNHTAKRTKRAETLANPRDSKTKQELPRPLVYILSGTPILNSPMDIFSQFQILDGGTSFGSNFFAFRARYFRDANSGMPKERYFPKWVPHPGTEEEFNRRIKSVGSRVLKSECLDLPPLVQVTHKVGMSPEQAKAYREMKQNFITYVNDKACVATIAITKALRLMQITSGFAAVKTTGEEDDAPEVRFTGTPKLEALRDLLEQLTPNHKVLVWAVWKENYQQIADVCNSLGVSFVEVHGGISPTRKNENVKRFQDDLSCRVFIGHPGSGGIGLNLTCSSYSIFYSRTFSLEHSLQAEARNHRGGSKEAGHERITRVDLTVEDTIDEIVTKKLAEKIEVGDKLLKDIVLNMSEQSN